jgi:hypothetical protein
MTNFWDFLSPDEAEFAEKIIVELASQAWDWVASKQTQTAY